MISFVNPPPTAAPLALDEPIKLSALQHWACCPRKCGLVQMEQAFDDKLHTLRGQAVHRRVDDPGMEARRGLRVERTSARSR